MSKQNPESQPGPETGTDVSMQALTQALRGGFVILYVVIALLMGYFFVSNFFRVEAGQRAVVLRFGKPQQTGKEDVLTEGKLHLAWPYPIDEKVVVSGGERSVVSSIGWFAPSSSANPRFNGGRDGYLLTRDWQILHIQAELRYEVEDVIRYNFEFADVDAVLRAALDSALTVTAAGYSSEDVLLRVARPIRIAGVNDRGGKARPIIFQDALNLRLRHLVATYDLGVAVKSVSLNPAPVLPRGNVSMQNKTLQQSRIDLFERLNGARERAKSALDNAHAQEDHIINDAKAESKLLAEDVRNEFAEFNKLWDKYKDDPEGLQVELDKKLHDTINGILSDPNVEITKLPTGPNGERPKVKLVVRRLPAKAPEAISLEDLGKQGSDQPSMPPGPPGG